MSPVTTTAWSKDSLWEHAPFTPWFAPGGGPSRAASAYGSDPEIGTLDIGALKAEGDVWKILWPRTPDTSDPRQAVWAEFDPSDPSMIGHANRFARYGAGQSFGGGLLHGHGEVQIDQAKESWPKVFGPGSEPTSTDLSDIEFSRDLAEKLGLIGGR